MADVGSLDRWIRCLGFVIALVLIGPISARAAESGDVVISEVAWMGTEASSTDEWVELRNTTDQPIDIADWSILGADTGACLNIGAADGTSATAIPDHGYLLYANDEGDVRNANGTPIVDIWDATIQLNNSDPGVLALYSGPDCDAGDGVIIDRVNADGGDWPAGDNATHATMERIDPLQGGSDANWATNDGSAQNGQDANGNAIHGTPKATNSVTPPNEAPTCADVSLSVDEGSSGSVAPDCSDPDDDTLSYAIVDPPSHGAANVQNGALHYAPDADVVGGDSFTYRADDGRATSNLATVDVTINAVATEGDGDPDDDGGTDAIDARICLQIADGVGSFTSAQRTACDVDGDGDVDRDDAERIARAAIGLTDDQGASVWLAGVALLGVGLALPIGRAARSARCGLAASVFVGLATLLTGCPGLIPALPDDAIGIRATVTSSEIRIEIQNMPNGGLAALEIEAGGLTFDATALRVKSIHPTDGWAVLARKIDSGSGEVRLVAVRTRGGTAEGRILTLPVEQKPGFSRGAADVAWNSKGLVLGDATNAEIEGFQTGTQP